MFDFILKKNILKKFLLINLIAFIIIGSGTIIYLKNVQPNLTKKKTANHIKVINSTINHIKRLNVKFEIEEIRSFLFSTRFLFQNLDRVLVFDNKFNLIGDTDTLDLDPRAFSSKLNVIEQIIQDDQNQNIEKKITEQKKKNKKTIKNILIEYSESKYFNY